MKRIFVYIVLVIMIMNSIAPVFSAKREQNSLITGSIFVSSSSDIYFKSVNLKNIPMTEHLWKFGRFV